MFSFFGGVMENPVGLCGMDLWSIRGRRLRYLRTYLREWFQTGRQHKTKNIVLYRSAKLEFIIASPVRSRKLRKEHGRSICSTGFRVKMRKRRSPRRPLAGLNRLPMRAKKLPRARDLRHRRFLVYFVDERVSDAIYKENFGYDLKRKHRGLRLYRHRSHDKQRT